MTGAREALWAMIGAGGTLLAAAGACGDPSHVFEGRLFVEGGRDCLGTTASVDVVEGERPGQCPVLCLAQPRADGGRALYVSTMCGPYPFMFDTSGTDPRCPAALEAFARDDTCLLDGGSSNPPAPLEDAGPDGDGALGQEGGPVSAP